MAHNRYGDYHLSRRILDYLLRYQTALGADAAVHIIPDLDDELYGNSFAEIKDDVPEQDVYYELQTYAADALFGLNRETQNGGGISFIPGDKTIESIAVYTNSTGNDTLYASLRTDIEDPQSELASAEVSVTQNGWQRIVFDEPVAVEPGMTYYLFVQADHAIAMFGSVSKPSNHAVMGYNYDVAVLGGFAESIRHSVSMTPRKKSCRSWRMKTVGRLCTRSTQRRITVRLASVRMSVRSAGSWSI